MSQDFTSRSLRRQQERTGLAPPLGGIWLRSVDEDLIEVLVEVDGEWRLAIREVIGGTISHIVETDGDKPRKWPKDEWSRAASDIEEGV